MDWEIVADVLQGSGWGAVGVVVGWLASHRFALELARRNDWNKTVDEVRDVMRQTDDFWLSRSTVIANLRLSLEEQMDWLTKQRYRRALAEMDKYTYSSRSEVYGMQVEAHTADPVRVSKARDLLNSIVKRRR